MGPTRAPAKPVAVADLARAWMRGAHAAGMPVVGKHFPGHGKVSADSHLELPVDRRSLQELLIETYRDELDIMKRVDVISNYAVVRGDI